MEVAICAGPRRAVAAHRHRAALPGSGPYGDVFGDPVVHRAFEDRCRLVRSASGEEVTSETTVYTGPDAAVPVGSRVTVWASTPHQRTAPRDHRRSLRASRVVVAPVDQADSLMGLQVRVRSGSPDPRDALALIDAVFELLHGATHLTLAGTVMHLAERTASTPMGLDQNGRCNRRTLCATRQRLIYFRKSGQDNGQYC